MKKEILLLGVLLISIFLLFGCIETETQETNEENFTSTLQTENQTQNQSTDQTENQSTDQTENQSTNQTQNQSTDPTEDQTQQTYECLDGTIVVDLNNCPNCPDSCDDNNKCTEDFCNLNTEYKCKHTFLIFCCGNEICEDGENCDSCAQDCGQCVQSSFNSYNNKEPYYSAYCDKIDPYNLDVRKAAAKAIKNDPGPYGIVQLLDIYDWVKDNIAYQNVILKGAPYTPAETLETESGDCKNQAVLIASMIGAIRGTAKVVLDPICEHAYTIVYFGPVDRDLSNFTQTVSDRYGYDAYINSFITENGTWVIFDPAGGRYPGDTLEECSGNRTVYYIHSCLSCVNQYPDRPFTYEGKCYSQCPSETIHTNNYSCFSCPSGYSSFENECLTCDDGYVLHTDGLCYQEEVKN